VLKRLQIFSVGLGGWTKRGEMTTKSLQTKQISIVWGRHLRITGRAHARLEPQCPSSMCPLCISTYIYIYIYIYNIYIHIYVHIHLYTCTYVYIYICIYMYTYEYICMLLLIPKCAMTPSYVSDNLFLRVPWLIAMCAITHSYVFHDSSIYVAWLHPAYAYPPAPINHVKYLRAGPAQMPVQNWYTANTNYFRLTDSCQAEIQNTTRLSDKPSTA
jgi:hypothetical protein